MAEEHPEVDRLSSVVAGLAEKVGLAEEDRRALSVAASMIAVERIPMKDITAKRGPLTADDRARMREHAAAWAEFAGQLEPLRELGVARILETYTEHWDGTGHPAGLSGEDIPVAARVLSVCYHYTGMTSDRAYRKALPHEHAAGELTRMSGTLLDPRLVEALLELTAAEGEAGETAVVQAGEAREAREAGEAGEAGGEAARAGETVGDDAPQGGSGGGVPEAPGVQKKSVHERADRRESAQTKGAQKSDVKKKDAGRKGAEKKKSAPGKGAERKSAERKSAERKSAERKSAQKRGARKGAPKEGARRKAARGKKRG